MGSRSLRVLSDSKSSPSCDLGRAGIGAKHKAAAFYVSNLTSLKPFVYGVIIIVILCLHVILPFVTVLKISVNKSENNYIKQSLTERMSKKARR